MNDLEIELEKKKRTKKNVNKNESNIKRLQRAAKLCKCSTSIKPAYYTYIPEHYSNATEGEEDIDNTYTYSNR